MKILIFCMLWSCATYGQLYFDQTYDAKGIEHVVIDNFKGSISVKSTNSNQISIKVKKSSSATLQTLELKEYLKDDLVAVYIDNTCKTEIKSFDPAEPFSFIRKQYNCNWGEGVKVEFPDLQFVIEIPSNINIYVSTVMDGKVEVSDIEGTVYASNVNGSIVLNNVSKVSNGTTVNGDVDVTFNQSPSVNARFSTINGEINLNVPDNTSVTTSFKSFRGDLYTNLDAVALENELQDKNKLKAGEIASIGEFSKAKIGTGKVDFYIETFNGNAYLKKNK